MVPLGVAYTFCIVFCTYKGACRGAKVTKNLTPLDKG